MTEEVQASDLDAKSDRQRTDDSVRVVEEKSELELALEEIDGFLNPEVVDADWEPVGERVRAAIGSVLLELEERREDLRITRELGAGIKQQLDQERESAQRLADRCNTLYRGLQNVARDLDLTQRELEGLG